MREFTDRMYFASMSHVRGVGRLFGAGSIVAGALLLGVSFGSVPAVEAQPEQPGPIVATPVDPGVSNEVSIAHPCPADQVLGTLPIGVGLEVFFPVGEVGENPVVIEMGDNRAIRLGCGENMVGGITNDELRLGCIFDMGSGAGVVEVPNVPCPPAFSMLLEAFGATIFDYGDSPTRVEAESSCSPLDLGPLRMLPSGDVIGDETGFEIDLTTAPEAGTAELVVAATCAPPQGLSPMFDQWCVRIEYDRAGLVEFGNVDCIEYGAGMEVRVVDAATVVVRAGCLRDAPILRNVPNDTDVIDEDVLGRPGEREVEVPAEPGEVFVVSCGDDEPRGLGTRGRFVVYGDPETGSVEGAIRFSGSKVRDPADHSEGVVFDGGLFAFPAVPERRPEPVENPIEMNVTGSCWSDTVGVVTFDGVEIFRGDVVEFPPSRVTPPLGEGRYAEHRVVTQCVADGSTGLGDGARRCATSIWIRRIPRADGVLPCEAGSSERKADGRITLFSFPPFDGDGFRVTGSCPAGQNVRLFEVASNGAVRRELGDFGFFPADEFRLRFDPPAGLDLDRLAAQCTGPGSRSATLVALQAGTPSPVNCFSSEPHPVSETAFVLSHVPCGFVDFRLPDTGPGPRTGVFSIVALALLGAGVAVRTASRRGLA